MSHPSLMWKSIKSLEEFSFIIDQSRLKPVLLFKHRATSPESLMVKANLEANWSISTETLDTYIVDVMQNNDIGVEAAKLAGVPNEFPQILLFADGVTMYDESQDMISVKKIKIALKIINRTFRWLETRV